MSIPSRIRNKFLTGLIVCGPLLLTAYIAWSLIIWADNWIKSFLPRAYDPNNYLPASIPGFGLLIAIVLMIVVGFVASHILGRVAVARGEALLGRLPFIRTIHRSIRQIIEAAVEERSTAFRTTALIEYPRPGLWSLVLIAKSTGGEVASRLDTGREEHVSVFLPTTPNPVTGILFILPRKDVILLDMSVEDEARMIISAGLSTPEYHARTAALAEQMKPRQTGGGSTA